MGIIIDGISRGIASSTFGAFDFLLMQIPWASPLEANLLSTVDCLEADRLEFTTG